MENKNLFTGLIGDFPKETDIPEDANFIKLEDETSLWPQFHPYVVYDTKDGVDLHLQIMAPYSYRAAEQSYPLVVYVQGSAWMKQDIYEHLYEMLYLCRKGYAVAIVEYRGTEIAPFPAQIEDAKTAVRYMRSHAAEYLIDPDRIAYWGDSSGGHTVLMAMLTNENKYDNGTYGDVSCRVKCLVDWYGPTNMQTMGDFPSMVDHLAADGPEGLLLRGNSAPDVPELAAEASPINYLDGNDDIVPICILHGNADEQVPLNQSVTFYNRLKELGKPVELNVLDGAHHAWGGFMNTDVMNICSEFLKKYL